MFSKKRSRAAKEKSSDAESEQWTSTGQGGGMLVAESNRLYTQYYHDGGFIRFQPRLTLMDLEGSHFLPFMNSSAAAKLKAIHVVANGYKLREISGAELSIDKDASGLIGAPFRPTAEQLKDPWVAIRGDRTSAHSLDFYGWTPLRRYSSRDVPDMQK